MLSQRYKNLRPYVAGEQPQDRKYIKLNTNENPYPPSPGIQQLLSRFDAEVLRLYPDNICRDLRDEMARAASLSPDQVFVGNGSDEVLSFCFYAFFSDGLVFPQFTYSFYPTYSEFYGISYHLVPQKEDLGVDPHGLAKQASDGGIILANPNSPTGMYLDPDQIRFILDNSRPDRAVVVDEAYIRFGGLSCLDLINTYKNLIVVQTFSKSHSLAGLRLGFAFGNPELIRALFAVKDSFNSYPIDKLAQSLGIQAIRDSDYVDSTTEKIVQVRDTTTDSLQKLGFRVLPSKANFLFAAKSGKSGRMLYEALKERGILVRFFDIEGISDYIRITIGTEEQMQSFLAALGHLA